MVLGLPRGGVPVAYEIAKVLHAPLDLCIVRKLGVPGHRELAMGAIATGGIRVLNEELESAVDEVACLLTPQWLHSISLWYEDFLPTTDEQVRNLLAQNASQLETWKSLEGTTVSQ